jgi:hypothetical protein
MTRDQILREIRRVTDKEGVPPGRQKFEKLTGLSSTAWLGKYWARWGDALLEAGFAPNEKRAPLALEKIMDAYLRLVEELGRIPTEGELRLKAHKEPAFPSHSTFSKRLGPKNERLTKVIVYAQKKGASNNLLTLLQSGLTPETEPSDIELHTDVQLGFVYLMKFGRYYKIGNTNSLDRRRYEIGLQLPERIQPIHSIETDDPSGIEAYWHNRFKAKRLNGEWFDLSPDDVRVFRRRKFM